MFAFLSYTHKVKFVRGYIKKQTKPAVKDHTPKLKGNDQIHQEQKGRNTAPGILTYNSMLVHTDTSWHFFLFLDVEVEPRAHTC